MREATPPPPRPPQPRPPQPQPAAAGNPVRLDKALGDAWSFCADNLAATTVPAWLISLPTFLISVFFNDNVGSALGALFGIIATMGTIRMVFLAASIGEKPTVMGGFIEGFSYFGRGILANIILVVSLSLIVIALAVVLAPGALLMDAGHNTGGIIYLVVGGIPAIWVLCFGSLRLSMTIAACADDNKSVGDAFASGMRYTKGRTSELFWTFFKFALVTLLLAFIFGFCYGAIAQVLDHSMPPIPALAIIFILSWPIHFFSAAYAAMLAKVYLALKPQPPADNKPERVKLTLDSVR